MNQVNFSLIESDQLLTYGKGIIGLFSNFDPATDNYLLRPFVTRALSVYNDYAKAYERELKNPYTEKLKDADKLRDGSFYYFRDFVASFNTSEVNEEKEASLRVTNILEKHGWQAVNYGYKKETAAFTKMINEIKDFSMDALQLLGATARFDKWVARETEFENIQKSSVTRTPSGLPTLVETRPKLIVALRRLMGQVEAHYAENPDDSTLAGYMKAINDLITLTMTTARAAETRQENKKKNPATDVSQA
jgi:hypothetical protein